MVGDAKLNLSSTWRKLSLKCSKNCILKHSCDGLETSTHNLQKGVRGLAIIDCPAYISSNNTKHFHKPAIWYLF